MIYSYYYVRIKAYRYKFFSDTYKTRKCETAKVTDYKMQKYTRNTFAACSPSLQYLLRVTAGYRLTSSRMTRVHQQNYTLITSTDVAERAVI